MEGVSNFGEVLDEPSVEVHESYEGLDIFYLCQLWPVCDSLDFNGVHPYMVFGDDESEVVHLSMFKFAFLRCRQAKNQHLPGIGRERVRYSLYTTLPCTKDQSK